MFAAKGYFLRQTYCPTKGKYDEAFEVLIEANRIKFKGIALNVKQLTKKYATVTNRIERWSPNLQCQDESSVKQLFLLGPSRSGKSSLEKLLIGIPNVCPMFENINLNSIDITDHGRKASKKLDMAEIFYHDEIGLSDNGHNLITSTSPESIFYIDHLLDGFVNSFIFWWKEIKLILRPKFSNKNIQMETSILMLIQAFGST